MLNILETWDHEMKEDSVGAAVWAYWQMHMFESLFKSYIPEHDSEFNLSIVDGDGFTFTDFFRNLITHLRDDMHSVKYNRLCANGFEEYKGNAACAYNVARALVETKHHLDRTVSKNPSELVWKNVHHNEYANMPWSLTPLKFLFHRSVPTAGNS